MDWSLVGAVVVLSILAGVLLLGVADTIRFALDGRARRRAVVAKHLLRYMREHGDAGAWLGDGLSANAHVSGRELPPARRAFHSYRQVR